MERATKLTKVQPLSSQAMSAIGLRAAQDNANQMAFRLLVRALRRWLEPKSTKWPPGHPAGGEKYSYSSFTRRATDFRQFRRNWRTHSSRKDSQTREKKKRVSKGLSARWQGGGTASLPEKEQSPFSVGGMK